MKKILKYVFFVLLIACFVGGCSYIFWWYAYPKSEEASEQEKRAMWFSDRPVPLTVEPGAYLAALNAVFEEDPEKAAAYYLKAAKGDLENKKLLRETYFFNAMLGNFDALREVVARLPEAYQRSLFVDYVKIAYAVQDNDWAKARSHVRPSQGLGEIVSPLLLAWSYAGEGNYQQAMSALDALRKQSGMEAYYNYHKGLMAMMMGQVFAADEAFQALSDNKLPTFSFYPEIRSFYVRQGAWSEANPFYAQWQVFASGQPATAELIMQRQSQDITAKRGMAEVFYNLSTAMGSRQSDYERALILSSLSLFLNPDQSLPKIWNAEILESVKKPHLAAYFYKNLSGVVSQTIDFKKAMNLIACGRESEAKHVLLRLQPTNQSNLALWWALASVYQGEKDWSAALRAYTRILELVGESDRRYASDVYFARAFVYGEQKEWQKSESDLLRALELNPENPMLLNHLGYLWLEKGDKITEGKELVEKAYQLQAFDPHIIDSMAFALYRQAEYQKALPLAEKTVDIMPQSSVANAHLGDIYEALGRHREAVFQYNKALMLKYDLTPELKKELEFKMTKQ